MAETSNKQFAPATEDGVTYLREMCERHARLDGSKVVIDLPESQINALGLFLLQAVCGFLLGLNTVPAATASRVAIASAVSVDKDTRTQQSL